MPRLGGAIDMPQQNDPGTPVAGRQMLYFKSDGFLYSKNPAGTVAKIDTAPTNYVTTDSTQTGLTGDKTSNGIWKAGVFSTAGLTGATAAGRWVGCTTSGAPASGTFLTGDFVFAQNGHVWICTAGGSPGTWVDAGSAGAVTSVAGRTGAVTLTAADIGAGTFPTGAFIHQAATSGIGLQIKAAATTPGDIQQWQSSAGTALAKVDSGGAVWGAGLVAQADATAFAPQLNLLDTKTGQATPNKYVRSKGGNLEFVQSAGTTVIATLTDAGAFNTASNLSENGNRVYSSANPPPSLWKDPVRAASTANVTIASALVNGLVMDGVTLATGDRVLLKNQTNQAENGIYVVVASGAASRAPDADTAAKIWGMHVHVLGGTIAGVWEWYNTNITLPTLGTTNLTFIQNTLTVAGRNGAVILTAADITAGAFPGAAYSLPAGQFIIQSGASGTASLVTKAPTGTASAESSQQWQTSGGSTVASVDGNGVINAADHTVAGASLPRGRVASAKISSTFTAVTANTEVMVTGLAATFTFVTGRRYKITARAQFQNLTATQGTGTMRVRMASGASVTTAGAQIGADQNAFPATAVWRIGFNCVIELVCVASGATTSQINAGQNTVGISAQIPTANSLVEASTGNLPIIMIEDIGV